MCFSVKAEYRATEWTEKPEILAEQIGEMDQDQWKLFCHRLAELYRAFHHNGGNERPVMVAASNLEAAMIDIFGPMAERAIIEEVKQRNDEAAAERAEQKNEERLERRLFPNLAH